MSFLMIILNVLLIGCKKDSTLYSVFTPPTPVAGVCHETTPYECLNSTTPANTREEASFYKWSCLGLYGGDDIHTCSQAIPPPEPIHGQCDTKTHYQCLSGTTPDGTREEAGFYKWSCLGLYGGNDIHTCSQVIPSKPIHGQCNEASHYQCLNGTTPYNTREEGGFYKWSCLGLYGGYNIHTCYRAIPPQPVHGQCDTTIHYQCLRGTTPAHTREEGDFYKWSCLGLHGGNDIHICSQAMPLEPVHGQCDTTMHYQCLHGTTPAHTREEGGFYKWSCLGLHGGNDIHTCSQAMPPVPVHGECDSITHYQCLHGTTPANVREEGDFYKWSCLGLHGGNDIHTCSQAIPLEPVDGECDTIIHYQCLNGTTPDDTREESGFYKWSCLGLRGGNDIHTCSQVIPPVPVHGECDSITYYECLHGTTPAHTREEAGFYKWSCLGLHGGSDIHTCNQAIPPTSVHGECDSITHYKCLHGTTLANTREEAGFYKWSCLGLHGGDDIHTCSQAMPPAPVHGACDTTAYYQCLDDTTPDNTREESGFYRWSCLGLHGGDDIHTCSQTMPLEPVHGACDTMIHYQCLNGTIPDDTREEAGSYKWSCLGLHGGDDIHTCSLPTSYIHHDSFEVTQSLSKKRLSVDILIVIDNSGTMENYQEKLGSRFSDLLSHLGGVNWQMAFINTENSLSGLGWFAGFKDGSDGYFYNLEEIDGREFRKKQGTILSDPIQILKPSMPNAQNLFLGTIKQERLGSSFEFPLTNIIAAIHRSENRKFFRKKAALATIILTNEGNDRKTPEEIITAVKNKFGNKKRFFAYGIVCEPEECPAPDTEADREYIPNIKKLVKLTGGVTENIDAPDYSPILQNISSNLFGGLTLKGLALRHLNVIPESISLTFTPSTNQVEWYFDAPTNRIVFKEIPPDKTHIKIDYDYRVPL